MNKPKYLIWWYFGRKIPSIHTRQCFSEHSSKKAWQYEIARLKKDKTITDLKYIKICKQQKI